MLVQRHTCAAGRLKSDLLGGIQLSYCPGPTLASLRAFSSSYRVHDRGAVVARWGTNASPCTWTRWQRWQECHISYNREA